MFSSCRSLATTFPLRASFWCCVLAVACTTIGCSKPSEQPHAPLPPLAAQPAPAAPAGQKISASFVANGAPLTYEALFTDDERSRIEERREPGGSGVYEFTGGRLMSYTGATLAGEGEMELRFDLNGRALSSRVGARAAREEEVQAIRARGDLLRSHALAQRDTAIHVKHTR